MNITIFGATGQIGQHLIRLALEYDHIVTAFTRNPDKLTQSHKNLRVVTGDILNYTDVIAATEGQDAVFCTLGMPLMNTAGLRAKGTKNIVRAMQETQIKRLICLSVFGANDSKPLLPYIYTALIAPLFLRHIIADHEAQENIVTDSALNWTLVRPGNFTKGGHTGKYRHGFTVKDKPSKIKISQPDLAEFMFKQMGSDAYLHKAPCISY